MQPELDIEDASSLRNYLAESGRAAPSDIDQARMTTLAGGVSNRTVKVSFPSGESWVLKQALSRLRVASAWFADPARIHREATAMSALGRLLPAGAVPRLVFEDAEHHVLAMEAVPEPHENWKTVLLAGRIEEEQVRQFASLLAALHGGGFRERKTLDAAFADRSYFVSLRLEPYYSYSAAQVPAAAGFLDLLIKRTLSKAVTLAHGDFSPKNILVHAGRLVLLDHEVMHFGDPAFDVGFSLTHLMSKAHHLAAFRGGFTAAALLYWKAYRAEISAMPWADGMEARVVEHALGCLLARAVGRSPLEYLSAAARSRQRKAVLELMTSPPMEVAALEDRFIERISTLEKEG